MNLCVLILNVTLQGQTYLEIIFAQKKYLGIINHQAKGDQKFKELTKRSCPKPVVKISNSKLCLKNSKIKILIPYPDLLIPFLKSTILADYYNIASSR